MIQPLRSVHRQVFIGLAALLPMIIGFGLTARHPQAKASAISETLAGRPRWLMKSDRLWAKHVIPTEIYGDSGPAGPLYIRLYLPADLNEPDLLLYWSTDAPDKTMPAQAKFLGACSPNKAIAFPDDAKLPLHLILYSLAHRAIYDTGVLERMP